MTILGLDFGSSSVKAAILRHGKVVGRVHRHGYKTRFDGSHAEVNANDVFIAMASVLQEIGAAARRVDCIAIDTMAPSWVAIDRRGKALTPLITHQDRRSQAQAVEIERRVGKARHLKLSGNRPVPGGISSTTYAWMRLNQPEILRKADLVGHLSTLLHRVMTGARVMDPSNASFTGLYDTLNLSGWCDELCDNIKCNRKLLPDILDGDQVAGRITSPAARRYGLTAGTPMLTGVMDGSAALLLRGAKPGQLLNVCGSTDVLALCTDHPRPDERLLTRAVGVGRSWVQVSTLAAAGTALAWVNRTLFSELDKRAFDRLVNRLAKKTSPGLVCFQPYLAGDRASVEQPAGGFTGLTLATTRQEMLTAVIDSLAVASAARLQLLHGLGTKISHEVIVSGGIQKGLFDLLHRDWKGTWRYRSELEASLRGLAKLAEGPGC